MKPATVSDAVQYARDIVDRKIVSNAYILKQCKSFLDDYERKQSVAVFRWYFDEARAGHVLGYVQLLNFIEGEVAGTPIRLSPWQAFFFVNAYGWRDKTDPEIRRYTRLICMVGRKNAKSTILASLALYETMYGPEGSQIVTMATQRDQAKLVWNMSGRMAQKSDPRLTDGLKQTTGVISNINNWSRYTPLSRESKRLDGLNIRLAIADESAAITDQNLFEVVSSSMGAQKSPQFVHITTGQAGAQSNPFYGLLDYAKKVLDGVIDDERLFTLAYSIDPGDEWDDESCWIKANPNLGISVKLEFLRDEAAVAAEMPSARANFRIKYLNEFITTSEAWLSSTMWERCATGSLDKSLPLYVGLDMGATSDLTAVSMVWAENGQFYFDAQCFIPEEAIKKAPKHVKNVYDQAVRDGILRITEGEITDHDVIYDYIIGLSKEYDLKECAYDTWSAINLTARLADAGLEMVRFDQSMRSMSPASKEVEMLIRSGKLKHLNNPFLMWMILNCEVFTDVNGNIKVRKGADTALKIDAIVAMIMAAGRAVVLGAGKEKKVFTFYIG